MPNWCECDLTVNGNKKELSRFKKFSATKKSVLDHNKFISYPKKFKILYDWCCKNWWTKWGICHAEIAYQNADEILYRFDSTWSPPLPVIETMGKKFPKLEFKLCYFEQGMGFNGMLIVKKGQVVSDVSGDYSGDRGG